MWAALLASQEEARAIVERALSGSSDRDEDRLVRWVLLNGVSPYEVFSAKGPAAAFSSLEGVVSVMRSLGHALRDDGAVAFVRTRFAGPRICFLDHQDPDFREAFLADIRRAGHGSQVLDIFEPVGILSGVDAFILEHARHEAERGAAYEQFMNG